MRPELPDAQEQPLAQPEQTEMAPPAKASRPSGPPGRRRRPLDPAQISPPPERPERVALSHALGAISALLPVGMFATDPEGRCWYFNQRLMDSLGFRPDSGSTSLTAPSGRALQPGAAAKGAGVAARSTGQPNFGAGLDSVLRLTGGPAGEPDVELPAWVVAQVRRDGRLDGYVGVVLDDSYPAESRAATLTTPRLLHTSERLVDTLLDNTADLVTVLNADGSWRYSNAAATRLLGFREDFDPATGIFDLLHPDDVQTAIDALGRMQAGELGPDETIEVRIRAFDGSWRNLDTTAEDLTDDPVVHGIVLTSRDVTERDEARIRMLEANQRLRTVVGSLHIAALVEDEHRSIVLTNSAFMDLFEIERAPEDLVGHSLEEVGPELSRRFGDPTRDSGEGRLAEILRDRQRVVGDRIALGDGRVLERDFVPISVDDEYRGHLWLFRDVTSQANAEAEWEQLLDTQREENRRLVELATVKSAFLAEISHELRTPMTSILSFTELLRDGVGKDDPSEQAEFLEVISRNADRLLRCVDDLLLLDRAETGALEMEWGTCDIPNLVAAAVATFARSANAKQISLESEVGEGPAIAGDAQRLAQMFDVLLSNAVKFTPENGHVLVTATSADANWLIAVADSGIGVPPAERGSLFERFYRASNARAARIPGSGLGLSVARAIATLHGGDIAVTGGDDGGTVVMAALPITSHQPDPDDVPDETGQSSGPKRR